MIKKILFLITIFASLLILKSNSVFAYTIYDGGLVSDCMPVTNYTPTCCEYCASLNKSSNLINVRCPDEFGWRASVWYYTDNCSTYVSERCRQALAFDHCGATFCRSYGCPWSPGDPPSCFRNIRRSWVDVSYVSSVGGDCPDPVLPKTYKCFCKYCGDGECDPTEDVWNCCTDCGVPARGCEDAYTAFWYTCENNTPVKHTQKCAGWQTSSCGCQGYEKRYYQKGELCINNACNSTFVCSCVKGKCGAECGRNSDCNDGNPATIDKCENNCTCSHKVSAPTPTPTPKLKLSPTPTPTPAGPTPTPPSFNFKAELYGDYNSSSEFATVSIEGDSFGPPHACQPPWLNCRQCSGWDTGLTANINKSKYCTDNLLEVSFVDSSAVDCCCNANHRACLYASDWHCCEEVCSSRGCTNTVIFNCLDWSCGPPTTPTPTSAATPSPTPTPLRGPVCTF